MRRARLEALRDAIGPTEAATWPTCIHCSDATSLERQDGRERWIPVEGFRVEPQVFRTYRIVGWTGVGPKEVEVADLLNPPTMRGTRGWFTVIAQCHGKETHAVIHVSNAWGVAHVRAAIQSLAFFGPDKIPEHALRRLQ